MGIGRPSSYTEERAEAVLERIVAGESLRKICADPEMPGERTVFQWLAAQPTFAQQYTRAREIQAHLIAEETRDIVDEEPDPARARVRFDQRRWHAGKLLPKVYGDRVTQEHTGGGGGPVRVR